VNPDGSPNAAVLVFNIKKVEDKYYLQLGMAENQTKANLEATGEGLAVYAAVVEGETAVATGARIYFKTLEDQAVLDILMQDARQGASFYEITEVLPLG